MALHGKIALVTGGSGGIGAAICKDLAKEGCKVAISYSSNEETAKEVATAVQASHGEAHIFKADMANGQDVDNLYQDVISHFGQIDILVLNAGALGFQGMSFGQTLEENTLESFEYTWRINTLAPFQLTRLCIPGMAERIAFVQGYGRVLYMSSVAGLIGGAVGPGYASSKSALHGLSHWIANTYAKKGITSNIVCPALIEGTNMMPGTDAVLKDRIPVGRFGTTAEVSSMTVELIKNAFITNQTVSIDGGLYPR